VGVPTWLESAADIGQVVAGLALPLAFVELAGLRRDRLRGQVDKVAPWPETPERLEQLDRYPDEVRWSVPVRVRVLNGSELPVFVNGVDVTVSGWGDSYAAGLTGKKMLAGLQPGVIAPGATWAWNLEYFEPVPKKVLTPPYVAITRVIVTDATGRQWKICPVQAGRAQRVHRWERRGPIPQAGTRQSHELRL
jgi:hypothetical protein